MQLKNRKINFVRKQGYIDATEKECYVRHPALMFQPRVILAIVSLGILFASATIFLSVALVLGFSSIFPFYNPFDAIYRRMNRRKVLPLQTAMPPRRFAQAFASAICLATALSLALDLTILYNIIVWTLLAFLCLLVFANFCFGSWLFFKITGKTAAVPGTLPSSKFREADK